MAEALLYVYVVFTKRSDLCVPSPFRGTASKAFAIYRMIVHCRILRDQGSEQIGTSDNSPLVGKYISRRVLREARVDNTGAAPKSIVRTVGRAKYWGAHSHPRNFLSGRTTNGSCAMFDDG